ncbi:MAG: hypothetical protein DYG89_19395 [Caldilinea sp. CFX5]|nr:hypothetical protein [Caldilinea sp. CFX5]
MKQTAAIVFSLVTVGVILFQLALAAGAPWGEYAMGGAYPGRFPPALRIAALIQAALLAGLMAVILKRAGLIATKRLSSVRKLAWVVVAYMVVAFVLNMITPSAGERAIWAPVTLVLLVCSVVVATGKPSQ